MGKSNIMQERQKIIQLLSSHNPDSIALGWELAAVFAKDLLELRKFGEGVFGVNVLDLSYNDLTAIPESIGQLQKLEVLYLFLNQLTTLPESIGQLHKLEWLWLRENPIPNAEQSRIRKLLPNCKIFF